MAKQNYRCAGCGIRTDPGEYLLRSQYCLRGLYLLTNLVREVVRGGDRAELGKRKEGARQGIGLGKNTGNQREIISGSTLLGLYTRENWVLLARSLEAEFCQLWQCLFFKWSPEWQTQAIVPAMWISACFGSSQRIV